MYEVNLVSIISNNFVIVWVIIHYAILNGATKNSSEGEYGYFFNFIKFLQKLN